MKQPNNADELVVLFFDDQPNLAEWKKLPQMLEQVGGALARFLALCQTHSCSCWGKQPCVRTAVLTDRRSLLLPAHVPAHAVQISQHFPSDWILTPSDAQALMLSGPSEEAPSIADLVARGKRLVLLSGTDYGDDSGFDQLIFSK